jgi:sugar O-acyltransferase (sialic acid O-acetyltransferase NeuD family)
MKHYAVFGASGCGRGVMPLARQQLLAAGSKEVDLVFVDDQPLQSVVNGHSVLKFDDWAKASTSEKYVNIAIANPKIRQQLVKRCTEQGIGFFEIRAANVVQLDEVQIGEAAILCPFVTLTSNIQIGRHFHANLYSYVEHDCIIGDYVTFAPGVKCNGNVVIEDGAYIGAGAVIKQGQPGKPLVIGQGAVVGMGAVVTKSVPPGMTVVGNPAAQLKK